MQVRDGPEHPLGPQKIGSANTLLVRSKTKLLQIANFITTSASQNPNQNPGNETSHHLAYAAHDFSAE